QSSLGSACLRTSAERSLQIPEEVLRVLDSHRQADEPIADAELGPHGSRKGGMRHERGMLDQALDPTQALGEREEMAALEHAARIVERSLQYGSHYPAVAARHLPARERMLRMTLQPGVVHALDLGMACEKLRDGERIRAVPLHPQRQSLDAAQRQEGVEWARHGSQRVLQVSQPLCQGAVRAH